MWARLDDGLIDHEKIADAGDILGRNGQALALAIYVVGLMYGNKHLTDGYLSQAVVKNFRHVEEPLKVADALTKVKLWEKVAGGFRIHDYHDYNPKSAAVKKRRTDDRDRKAKERARDTEHGNNGAGE